MTQRHALWIVGLIAGLSGFCSLLYQVIWDRTVRYNFGGDTISSAIVTGTFLLGLGLGAYIFGQWRRDAYRSYALIEICIGLFAIVSFYLISPVAEVLASTLQTNPDHVEGLRPVVVIGCILLLLPPCTLIGGTLPLMFRCFIAPSPALGRRIGLVYGLNTLGASIGIFAVPLVFLNHLSLPQTLTLAGFINIGLGLLILRLRPTITESNHGLKQTEEPLAGKELIWLVLGLAFVSGFVAIGFEISLFRTFQIVNPSSAYNFPAVLAPFLLAIAIGSIIFTRGVAESRDAILARVGLLLTASAVTMFVGILASSYLRAKNFPISFSPILDMGINFEPIRVLWVVLFAVVIVMPVPLLTGAIFPLLVRLNTSGTSDLSETTGRIYLVNSLGAFAGALLGKFFGFPLLGTQGFLTLLYAVSCVMGLMTWGWVRLRHTAPTPARSIAIPIAMALIAVAVVLTMPAVAWRIYIAGSGQENLEVREGVTGVAQILWGKDFGDVRVNGQGMARLPDHPRHIKQSVFLLSQPHRTRVLVLGLGGGNIVHALVNDPDVQHIDVVDWSYELPVMLSSGRADAMLDHALNSPKVRIIRTDARVAVTIFDKGSFDIVFDNLAYAHWIGSSSINSESYFRKIRDLLKPQGVFAKGANYRSRDRLSVLAGLVKTFDRVEEHADGEVVIASHARPVYDDSRILDVMKSRASKFDLPPPYGDWFKSGFVVISEQDVRGIEPIRDDLLIHEYFWHPYTVLKDRMLKYLGRLPGLADTRI